MSDSNRATDERPPIIVIDQDVVDDYQLHPLAGWLYVVIVRHVNRKSNDAFPSVTRLAKLANMSKASVIRYTKALEAVGLIAVVREKSDDGDNAVNHYHLLEVKRGVSQQLGVVSDRYHGGITVLPPVVSESNHNHIQLNQIQEPVLKEGARSATPLTHAFEDAANAEQIDDAADSAYQRIDNHTGAMMQADVFIRVFEGACKAWNAPQTIRRTRENKRVAAQWYVDGYKDDEIRRAVGSLFEAGKPIKFTYLGEQMAHLRNGFTPASISYKPRAAPATNSNGSGKHPPQQMGNDGVFGLYQAKKTIKQGGN